MSFLEHIRGCNNYNPARTVPLFAGINRIGLLRRDNAEALRRFPKTFAVAEDEVKLLARGDIETVSRCVDEVVEALVAEHCLPKWRNETFDVASRWGAPPVFRLDRGAVPFFGTRAYGVHLNGYRRDGDLLHLWVGRRALDKQVAPDKLDNIVAGGIGNGHGVADTLLKEGEEEASIPPSLTGRSRAPSACRSRFTTAPRGARNCRAAVGTRSFAGLTPTDGPGATGRPSAPSKSWWRHPCSGVASRG